MTRARSIIKSAMSEISRWQARRLRLPAAAPALWAGRPSGGMVAVMERSGCGSLPRRSLPGQTTSLLYRTANHGSPRHRHRDRSVDGWWPLRSSWDETILAGAANPTRDPGLSIPPEERLDGLRIPSWPRAFGAPPIPDATRLKGGSLRPSDGRARHPPPTRSCPARAPLRSYDAPRQHLPKGVRRALRDASAPH